MRIGIDAGGTFTDFIVLHEDGRLETFKLRSNPANPASVILSGIERAASGGDVEVVHGSTVATNALLERKGARTALVTTAGFEDVIQIGRQNRARLYDLNPPPKRPLIPRDLCLGVAERTCFDGTILAHADREQLRQLGDKLRAGNIEAVAVCFLHSYTNAQNEEVAAQALAGDYYLCVSHEVCPEFREYERTSTTVLNAYVGPLMDRYLGALERSAPYPIRIMQSNGGVMAASDARRHAVRTLLSGPAGGVVGAVESARVSGFDRVLAFDMGGTSTDVSLSEGQPVQSMEASIDGFPVRVPMLDIHTVGAGGGSIARVDEGGLLRVGPESAGADPGPACYGTGTEATVTDAHVVLGRIDADQLVGGGMHLDVARAEQAVDAVAARLGIDRMKAAQGIIRIANSNMERAIRVVSVERGHDPRDFALLAFGGCGGLHACEIGEELGMQTVLVPEHAGVLSALGMLAADRVSYFTAAVLGRNDLDAEYMALEARARREMPQARMERSMDVRYAGQSYELNVPDRESFHAAHHKTYGYSDPSRATEVVNLRVRAVEDVAKPALVSTRSTDASGPQSRRVFTRDGWRDVSVSTRSGLAIGASTGPLLVVDYGATTWIAAGWSVELDATGALVIRRHSR